MQGERLALEEAQAEDAIDHLIALTCHHVRNCRLRQHGSFGEHARLGVELEAAEVLAESGQARLAAGGRQARHERTLTGCARDHAVHLEPPQRVAHRLAADAELPAERMLSWKLVADPHLALDAA